MQKGILTYTNLGKFGRLGNQMFQVASTIGLAENNQMDYAFSWAYQKYFQHALPKTPAIDFNPVGEPEYFFNEMLLNKDFNIDLMGYFQSEKYFKDSKEAIKYFFTWEETFINSIIKKHAHIISQKPISLHVRREDYLNEDSYVELKAPYYHAVLDQFESDIPVLVFSDDIEWCKQHLDFNRETFFAEGNSDIEDLALMTLCNHFIIANSTFSWWGAWLGEKESSVVIAPPVWYTKKAEPKLGDKDLIPERWIRFSPDKVAIKKQKIDLTDITFTIPVKYDHKDRAANLELIIKFLKYHFDTNIIVMETGEKSRFKYLENEVEYVFWYSSYFHRTNLLNNMATMANTPFIANWDADILIHQDHILKGVEMLRNGGEMVYPYDGTFHRIPREYFAEVNKTLSVQSLRGIPHQPHEFDQESFGGAVFWNKDKFLEIGGENENFISYGPEDYERYHRAKILELKIDRVIGPLFHIDHYVGNDSSGKHLHFKKNQEEFNKVKSLSKGKLLDYINSWIWKKSIEEHHSKNLSQLLQIGFDRTYLINLDRNPERLDYAENELFKIGYENFERWPAVDGKALRLKSKNKRLTPGMIGCYQSHLNVLEDAIKNSYETIMVFEDDIKPVDGFADLLEQAFPLLPKDWEFVFWGYGERGPFGSYKKMVNDYWVVPGCPWGTQAYMVRGKETIKKLYDLLQGITMQIDEKLANTVLPYNGFKYYGVFPSLINQNMQDFPSEVQTNRDNKITITR